MKAIVFLSLLFSHTLIAGIYPTSFSTAKKKAESDVYFDKLDTFYCDCDYFFDDINDRDNDGNTHETIILPENCGYVPRKTITSSGKPNRRSTRIEWEHVMPAHMIGGHLDEWKHKENYDECRRGDGKFSSGRYCAYLLNTAFRNAHDDMVNLVPVIGELNGDRLNYQFADITGEARHYGACDFEVDFAAKTAEPDNSVKGDIARIYFHMIEKHGAQVDNKTLTLMNLWDKLDPVDDWECERNVRIESSQGTGNDFVNLYCSSITR